MATVERTRISAPPVRASGKKARLQRTLAALTVGVPTLGFALAMVQLFTRGVGALELTVCAVMYALTALGVEAGLHRYFSHHACRGGRAATRLLGALGSMAGQGPILFWAAIHRAHHAHADEPGDPHSPWLAGEGFVNRSKGLWHAHVGWLFTTDESDWQRWVPDLLRDRDVVLLNQRYLFWLGAGLLLPAAVGALWVGTPSGALRGALWGGLVRMFLLDHVTWAVNSLGHTFGARPSRSDSRSGNIGWLALPSMGGSWHNNHHAFPSLARNDVERWQVDFSGYFLELLTLLHLVTDVHRPQRLRKHASPPAVTREEV